MFDDDEHDLEIRAERLGASAFDQYDLARLLGVTPNTVRQSVMRGSLERPTNGQWTALQVARILNTPNAPRPRSERVAPCGTWAAYARHKRHHEPVDILCQLAMRRRNREQKAAKRAREKAVA